MQYWIAAYEWCTSNAERPTDLRPIVMINVMFYVAESECVKEGDLHYTGKLCSACALYDTGAILQTKSIYSSGFVGLHRSIRKLL